MKDHKQVRNFVLAAAAGCGIFFSPVGNVEASASASESEVDFSSRELRLTAKEYLDSPYRYGGTTASGFDCSGYVQQVFEDLDITLPRSSNAMFSVGEPVNQNELKPGDLVFFNTSGNGISHVGIYYGNGMFIHSQVGDGVSITSINDPHYWASRYVGAKRVADVQLLAQK